MEVTVDLSSTKGLGVSVIKQDNGWLVQKINEGPIDTWNRSQRREKKRNRSQRCCKAVCIGDRIISANELLLTSGMEAIDCSSDGRLSLQVAKAKTICVSGCEGVILWDAARRDPTFVKVRWEDGTATGLLWHGEEWQPVPKKIFDAFIGEPAHVDLSCRNLGDEGSKQVALILEYSGLSIVSLCLNYNHIQDSGAQTLADAIEKCDVKTVDLFGMYFSTELRDRIEETLWCRRARVWVLTVHGVQEGPTVTLSFSCMSGDEGPASMAVDPSMTIAQLRRVLVQQPEARKRHIELVLPEPHSRCLADSDHVCQVILHTSTPKN